MQKLKNVLQNRRGETIVEVLVAFVLLMLFLALFTVSLRFARRASVQAQTTRDNAYTLTSALYPANDAPAAWQASEGKDLSFSRSDRPAFTVKNVQLQTWEVTADNGAAHTFTRYYKEEDTTP